MKMRNGLSRLTKVLDLFAPPRCHSCGAWSEEALCPICRTAWEAEKALLCRQCGKRQDHCSCLGALPRQMLGGAVHLVSYRSSDSSSLGKRLVLDSKEWLDERLAIFLATQLAEAIRSAFPIGEGWAIAFVPRAPASKRRIGYDQAELLAKELSRALSLPLLRPLVHLQRGKAQKELSAAERMMQAACVYQADPKRIGDAKGLRLLLVDDVLTTGASLSACAAVLRSAGDAREVYAVTVARTDPKDTHPTPLRNKAEEEAGNLTVSDDTKIP